MLNFKNHQQGSSLLEVLISLLVMAIGLLGLASVQIISLKNLNNSQFRSLSTTYAYAMAERMRSNQSAVVAGNYDAIDDSADDPNCTNCSASTNCTIRCLSMESINLKQYCLGWFTNGNWNS
ncbi:type IV pilus modification protein PilV [Psychromonas sp. KJ10-10]|uniref:type IV pilus modification protein PilV n=1 Tax=Psychromonas sp. KJ10-10 TaxID=3391823 RepID=UPI0039B5FA6E